MMPDLLFYALALLPSAVLGFALVQARRRAGAAEREARKTRSINDALQRANSAEISAGSRFENQYIAERKARDALERECEALRPRTSNPEDRESARSPRSRDDRSQPDDGSLMTRNPAAAEGGSRAGVRSGQPKPLADTGGRR